MGDAIVDGLGLLLAGASLAAATPATARPSQLQGPFPIVELRQYTLREGRRDELIDLFEREFVESQEAEGMKVIGTFRDLDRPDRFVWLRGFRDMDSRLAGLTAFYGGPVWKAHREAANATMVDSDDVLLLRAPSGDAQFALLDDRPALGERRPAGLVVASIHHLRGSPEEALAAFEGAVKARLEQAGAPPIAWFVTETARNTFPQLPVREGEKVLVWFARFPDAEAHAERKGAIDGASAPLKPFLAGAPEVLRLAPTARSQLR